MSEYFGIEKGFDVDKCFGTSFFKILGNFFGLEEFSNSETH